jgi:hypothetical protein
LKNTLVALSITLDFAYEAVRAFFRPKLSEELQVPIRKPGHISAFELERISKSPNAFFYFGLGIEVITATLVFIAVIGLAFASQVSMEAVVSAHGNPEKWEPVITLVSSGVSLVGLVLLFIFAMKVWQAVLHRFSKDA